MGSLQGLALALFDIVDPADGDIVICGCENPGSPSPHADSIVSPLYVVITLS